MGYLVQPLYISIVCFVIQLTGDSNKIYFTVSVLLSVKR